MHGVIYGVEVTLDDEHQIRQAQPTVGVEREGTVDGVDMAVGELNPFPVEGLMAVCTFGAGESVIDAGEC